MNILFDNLESLIDAPNGIEKARELILQLAIQGKLTEQNPKDEPATELLKKIKKEKEKLIAKGAIKKQNELSPISDEEKPFELPKGWVWARLNETISYDGLFIDGDWVESKDQDINGDVRLIQLADVGDGYYRNRSNRFLTKTRAIKLNCTFLKKGDILIARMPDPLGRSCIFPGDKKESVTVVDVAVVRLGSNDIDNQCLINIINSKYFRSEVDKLKSGTTRKRISRSNLSGIIFPFPPANEQKRIVEKVNSLMALLDELEEKRKRRNQKRIKINNASIEKLLTSKDVKELKTNWKQIEENFSTLYSVPENVEKLKQAILQLAVQGKLVKQSAAADKDEPASELLKKIQKEKEKLIAEGKIKKQTELPLIKDEEKPFELPSGWEWCQLITVIELKSGVTLSKEIEKPEGEIPYLKVADMNLSDNLTEIKCSSRYINKSEINTSNLIPANSIIFPKRGGAIATDKRRLVRKEIAVDLNIMAMICPEQIELEYLHQWFLTVNLWELNSGTSVPQINNKDLYPLNFPLPPFNEQKRIVEKVNELMSLCNALEEKLTKKEATAEKLIGAVVNRISKN